MTDLTLEKIGMPLTDWQRRYDEDGAFEYVRGEIIPLSPPKFRHAWLSKLIYDALFAYLNMAGLSVVFQETPFVELDQADWVTGSRVPDVMVFSKEKLDLFRREIPNHDDKPLILIPDLVVEIISPTDSYSQVDDKVVEYLERGLKSVWVVNPRNRTIVCYQPGDHLQRFRDGDTLSDPMLPGFSLVIADFFDE